MPKELIDDELWSLIEPLLPARASRNRRYAGRKPTPDRAVLTGIVFVLRSGVAWNLLPQEMGCGSGTACWRRLVAGVWQRIHETLLAELRRRGQLDLARAIVDSSSSTKMKRWTERSPRDYGGYACITRPATPVSCAHGVAYLDRHFANGYAAIRKLARRVFSLKAVAHCAAQTGRFLRLIGRRSSDCVLSAKAPGESRMNCDCASNENYPSRPFTRS